MDLRKTIAAWPVSVLDKCLQNWDEFERVGSIGECTLREEALVLVCRYIELPVTTLMRDIAFEAYRRNAYDLGWKG